jgi:hypothetical protein
MATYLVVFFSGERLEVKVDDAEDFSKTVADALNAGTKVKAKEVWLSDPHRLLNVNQIAYVVKR